MQKLATPDSLGANPQKWTSLSKRVRNGEMPPKGSPAPGVDARLEFAGWVESALREQACASGITPGPSLIRRLNRDEYSNTIRDLLDIHLDIGRLLPADGAGG